MENQEKKIALINVVNDLDFYLMKDGSISSDSDYDSEEIFKSEIMYFYSKKEAEKFIEKHSIFAMQVATCY